METLKVGLIATGGRGHNGWQAHQPEKGVTIVAGRRYCAESQRGIQGKIPGSQDFRGLQGTAENG